MNNNEQWQAANNARATLYRWFADIFAKELTSKNLIELQARYADIHQAFCGLGLEQQSGRLQQAFNNLKVLPESDRALELAADFAQMFLLSGRDSAPPYASYYLEKDQMLYGKPAQQMSRFLDSHALSLHPEFREPKDHISIYLQVMSLWIKASLREPEDKVSIAEQQAEFLDGTLLNWLAKFKDRCQRIAVKTAVYPALAELLLGFVKADREGLAEIM